MIPYENKFFIVIALLLVIILGVGYVVFDDEDGKLKLPAHPVEELKNRLHKDSQ